MMSFGLAEGKSNSTDLDPYSHILSLIKHGSIPSLCIGKSHGTVLELRNKTSVNSVYRGNKT